MGEGGEKREETSTVLKEKKNKVMYERDCWG